MDRSLKRQHSLTLSSCLLACHCSYYEGGFDNTNDVFIWGLDIDGNPATNPNMTAGDGQMYAFQLPVLSDSIDTGLTPVGGSRSFQSALPPVLANNGLNLYWSVTRSQLRCWAGEANLARDAFHTGPSTSEFTRGDPFSAEAKAPPTVTSGDMPFVFGPSAENEIFKANFDCSVTSVYTFTDVTPTIVSSKVVLSVDELFIYVATPKGDLLFFDTEDITNFEWTLPVGGSIAGNIARSVDGTYIYTADVNGAVRAFQVREAGAVAPTTAPSNSTTAPVAGAVPTTAPSASESPIAPSAAPTANSTASPTETRKPTDAPTGSSAPTVSVAPTLFEATDPPVTTPEPSPDPPTAPGGPSLGASPPTSSAIAVMTTTAWALVVAAVLLVSV